VTGRTEPAPGAQGTITEISVADTGIGIRTEDQARLFQAFEQVSSSEMRRREGTGWVCISARSWRLARRPDRISTVNMAAAVLFRLVIEES
jgi:hypothetical protein